MAANYWPCRDSYLEKTAKLSDPELGRLFRALMLFHATGEHQELDGRESIAYDFIEADIAAATRAYENKCAQNRENASSRKQSQADGSERKPPIETKPSRSPAFVPPDVQEVREYCASQGYTWSADEFWDFYASKNWMVGKNKMKDWKAACRNWNRYEHKTVSGRKKDVPYGCGELGKAELEAIQRNLAEPDLPY